MLSVIGDVLPIAAVIALNPIIIIVMVLMLLAPGGRATSAGFLVGWLVGIVALTSAVILLASLFAEDGRDTESTIGVIEILLGTGLIYFAWKQWKSRPSQGESVTLPSWMAAVDSMSASRSMGLGLMLAVANPKNIALIASAALLVVAADLRTRGVVVVVLVFTLVATTSVGGPFIAYILAPERTSKPLQEFREWLIQNSSTILAVMFLIMGVTVIGKGIGLV